MNALAFLSSLRPADMSDEREATAEQRSGYDRRAAPHVPALSNPAVWIGICGLLLTVVLAVLGAIFSQLSTINANIIAQQAAQQATRETMLTQNARLSTESESLRDRVVKLESAMETQTKAYNFNFTTRLAVIESRTGIKPKE